MKKVVFMFLSLFLLGYPLYGNNHENNSRREIKLERSINNSKYTYWINPGDLGRKWYYPRAHGYNNRIDKWDISQQSLHKFIYVDEVDESETRKETLTVVTTYTQNFKSSVDGSIKVGDKGDIKVGLGYDSSTSKQITSSVETTTNKSDDELGNLKLYFYDPVIIQNDKGKGYRLKDISTGTVAVTFMPMSDPFTRSIKD